MFGINSPPFRKLLRERAWARALFLLAFVFYFTGPVPLALISYDAGYGAVERPAASYPVGQNPEKLAIAQELYRDYLWKARTTGVVMGTMTVVGYTLIYWLVAFLLYQPLAYVVFGRKKDAAR